VDGGAPPLVVYPPLLHDGLHPSTEDIPAASRLTPCGIPAAPPSSSGILPTAAASHRGMAGCRFISRSPAIPVIRLLFSLHDQRGPAPFIETNLHRGGKVQGSKAIKA
jgi:hypothetical protein